jgi:energy-coupling factor transport system ATP-binding protein
LSVLLELDHLSFRYHKESDWLFSDLSISLEKGSITAITGSNGSGKTTLLFAICGIIPKLFKGIFQGHVTYLEQDLSDFSLPQISQWMSILMQESNHQLVFPIVEQELAFGPENMNIPADQIENRICKSLSSLDITDLRFAQTFELSYGQKKLIALASLLVMESPILLLDEPAAGLDEHALELLKKLLLELSAQGRIIILADHEPGLLRIATQQIDLPFSKTSN